MELNKFMTKIYEFYLGREISVQNFLHYIARNVEQSIRSVINKFQL